MIFPEVPKSLGLYPVVDSSLWIERLLALGVKTLQLRIKQNSANHVEQEVVRAIHLAQQNNARLFINDYWQLAIKHRAYGVHLGQEDLLEADLSALSKANIRLGVSTHSGLEIDNVLPIKPSYIALGPVYPTQTKQMDSLPQGLKNIQHHVNRLNGIPTVAIGGISIERAPAVLKTGVGSIAVVSAITQADNWREATQLLQQIVAEAAH